MLAKVLTFANKFVLFLEILKTYLFLILLQNSVPFMNIDGFYIFNVSIFFLCSVVLQAVSVSRRDNAFEFYFFLNNCLLETYMLYFMTLQSCWEAFNGPLSMIKDFLKWTAINSYLWNTSKRSTHTVCEHICIFDHIVRLKFCFIFTILPDC